MSDVAQTAPADGCFRPALSGGSLPRCWSPRSFGVPRVCACFRCSEVQVTHELREVRRSELEESLAELLAWQFLHRRSSRRVRQSLEGLPWVRRAEIWRKWPSRLEVRIEEHQAAAHWGDGQGKLVNTYGEVFPASLVREQSLPRLSGPTGSSGEVLRRYEEFAQLMKPVGLLPAQLALSPRLAWLVKLEDGMWIELGREQPKAPIRMRLQRFVDYYPTLSIPVMGGRWRWICGIQTVSHCAFRPVQFRKSKERNEQG
jgi:cell division protein FtsQ